MTNPLTIQQVILARHLMMLADKRIIGEVEKPEPSDAVKSALRQMRPEKWRRMIPGDWVEWCNRMAGNQSEFNAEIKAARIGSVVSEFKGH